MAPWHVEASGNLQLLQHSCLWAPWCHGRGWVGRDLEDTWFCPPATSRNQLMPAFATSLGQSTGTSSATGLQHPHTEEVLMFRWNLLGSGLLP